MKSWRLVLVFSAFIWGVFLCNVQAQEKYPNRDIQLVVPYGPGGTNDITARLYSRELAQALKVRVVVVNRPGGGGIQGALYVARAKKDGYTLLHATGGGMTIVPIIAPEATYDTLKDYTLLGQFGTVPSLICVRNDSPFKTFGEMVEYARKNPGKIRNAVGGQGTGSFLNLLLLSAKANVQFNTIPFQSGGETVTALLGGHVDMTSSGFMTLGPLVKAGKILPLATVAVRRHPNFPNIPTTAEVGYPYVNFYESTGLYGPAGLPRSVRDVLVPAVRKAFTDPDVVARSTPVSFMPDYKNPDDFRKFLDAEIRKWREVFKDAGLSVR